MLLAHCCCLCCCLSVTFYIWGPPFKWEPEMNGAFEKFMNAPKVVKQRMSWQLTSGMDVEMGMEMNMEGRMVICHNLISDIWKNSAESLFWLWYSTTELSISPKMSKSGSFLFWCFHSAVNYDLLSICFKLQRPRNWCTWSIALAGTAAFKFVSCIGIILNALLFCISRDKLGRVINQKLSQALMK